MDDLATSFVDDGYVVCPQLVTPHEVDELRADAALFSTGHYPLSNLPDDGRILAVHFPHWVSPVFAAALHHPGVVDVLGRITGAHLAHWDGGVKAMQSMLFVKPGGLPGQAWHQDERYIPTRDRSLMGAWIALDDATVANGCLWVLPGSHRPGVLHRTRSHGRPDEFDPSEESFGFDDVGAIPVEVRAGDVVFFNGYLLHRSLRNRTDGTRRALVNHYMSMSSPLPWLVHEGLDVGGADNRAVVPVAGVDPYEWKGYGATPSAAFVRPAAGEWKVPDRLR